MFVELSRTEAQFLAEIVTAKVHELERMARLSEEQAAMKSTLELLEHRLHEAEWDVTC